MSQSYQNRTGSFAPMLTHFPSTVSWLYGGYKMIDAIHMARQTDIFSKTDFTQGAGLFLGGMVLMAYGFTKHYDKWITPTLDKYLNPVLDAFDTDD